MANPLSRRLLQLAGLLSLLLIAVVVNYLLHDGSEVLNPIAEAAQRTAAMPGARLKLEVTYSAAGGAKTVVGTGAGAFDARTGRARVDFTVPIPGQTPMTVTSLGDQRTVYMRSPVLTAELPAGKEWLGMEPLLGHDPDVLGGGPGARGTLEELRAVGGGVEELDHQIVRGHRTTRYKSSIDLSRVADTLAERGDASLAHEYEALAEKVPDSIPVEVWIDGNGLARLIRMVQPLPTVSGGPTVTMDMRMEFFDFGARPKVTMPPRSRVLDYTPVLRAELGLEDGHGLGPLSPPAGTKPLPTATFHRRVEGICRAGTAAAKGLLPRSRELTDRLKALGPDALRSGEAKPLIATTGRWFERSGYGLLQRLFRKLVAVAPPARYAADYRRWLRLNAQEAEWILAEARAYQLGVVKVPGAGDHEAEAKRQKREAKKLAASLGISGCETGHDGASAEPA